jgi:hypothetical protein
MKIVIDNPCHENWDAMSPNEKGAFCLSCQKTVIDFSVQTVEEIKNFFVKLPKTESVCGRFKEEQLDEMSFEHFFNQFKGWKFFQKAAVIVFFIFGFSLFGNAQNNPRDRQVMMKGEVAFIAPPDTIKKKPVKDSVRIVVPNNDLHMLGGPRFIPDNQIIDNLSDHAVPPYSDQKLQPKKEKLMGKPAVIHNKE